MGLKNWFKKKSQEKSVSNIVDGLRSLIKAVQEDFEGADSESPYMQEMIENGIKESIAKMSEAELSRVTQSIESWKDRKNKVVKAQKNLLNDITLWSSLSFEQNYTEVIIPVLFSGQLIPQSELCFEPVWVATYRVCEAAANQRGFDIETHTPEELLQIVEDAGDLYI